MNPKARRKIQEERVREFLKSLPGSPRLAHIRSQAFFYNRLLDVIACGPKSTFKTLDAYYHAVFHELIHWTGHRSRLNRLESERYEVEEDIADFGANLLCERFGFKPYRWQGSSSRKPRRRFKAKARQAVNFLLGKKGLCCELKARQG